MLWLMLVASVLGFLAVVPVSQVSQLPLDISNIGLLWQAGLLTFAMGLISLIVSTFFRTRHSTTGLIYRFLLSSMLFTNTLVSSCSFGLIQLSKYQQSLLNQPLTIEATVTPQMLSDSINIPLNPSNSTQSLSYGTLYPRQLWQITQIQLEEREKSPITIPMTVMVTANLAQNPDWQTRLNQLRPNDTLQVKLALQPINQTNTANLPNNAKPLNLGFDQALWLRERGVQATGEVLEIDNNSLSKNNQTSSFRLTVEQWRWQFRQLLVKHFQHSIEPYQAFDNADNNQTINALGDSHAILLGLLTGDKALMDSDIKGLYQVTGISHLLAISGPHVTLLASIVAMLVLALVKWLYPALLLRLPSRLLVLWVSVAVAGVYALLVGFELPAQRTFWLLLLVTLSSQWLIASNAYRLLGVVGLLMLWADSTAVLQAGFWLSFVAVALLLKFSQSEFDMVSLPDTSDTEDSKIRLGFNYFLQQSWALLKLQLWLFVWMMPIVVWFFGKVSLMGIMVNLIAVPLLGLVVVPLDMLAGLLSLLPVMGEAMGGAIWSGLSQLLMIFHHVLAWLVDAGLAKQAFFSFSHSQLVLLALVIGLVFGRNILPKATIVPLLMACVAITVARHQDSEKVPILAVMDNAKVSISLLKKGDDAWLILADNQNLAKPTTKKIVAKKAEPRLRSINQSNTLATRLNDDILALLATYHVDKLTGVINQTPSEQSNAWVQTLANRVTIKAYWLAGLNPLEPTSQPFTKITPKNCGFGQTWHSEDSRLTLTAVSGWQLALPKEQVSDDERLASQSCFLQITNSTGNAKQPYLTLLTAGQSSLPLAMSMKLCEATPSDLLINPYQTPLDKDWLRQSQPKILHLLTGSFANETLSDSSQFALADSEPSDKNHLPNLVFAHQSGAVEYQLGE